VSVKPLTRQQLEDKNARFAFVGEKLSLNFQDIEVRKVLEIIADFTDLNLVASDTVQGNITLRLENVPWDQALELVLKSKGLDKRVFELFGGASSSESSDSTGSQSTKSILSERGSAIVDERTNSIILTETADKIAEFKQLITQVDIPVRQVMIEARIVTATSDLGEELGLQTRITGADTVNSGSPINTRATTFLSAPGTVGNFGINYIGSDFNIDLELSAVETAGLGDG